MRTQLIYMTNTSNASVLADGIIPLTTIQRKYGCAIVDGTNSVILRAPGYYKVTATVTLTVPTAGDAAIKLQKNNADIPGMESTETITTATTEVRSLTISGIVRVYCNEGFVTLTLINSGVESTISNVSLDVEYLG